MPQTSDDFFESKDSHPWSKVKDRILGSYVTVYLAKISWKQAHIILVDAFAGPGVTEDGEPGSPLIICRAAERYARGRYNAFFVNKDETHHQKLKDILRKERLDKSAKALYGDGPSILSYIGKKVSGEAVPQFGESVLLYVDPFGLDCEFQSLEPFLNRSKKYSTEILVNLQMPIVHRLAAREATKRGTEVSPFHKKWHEKLTRTFGGEYWREILFSDEETGVRERMLVDGYRSRLASTGYLTYTGACPIQERRGGVTKYFFVFASRHPDAMVICNDAMCNAVNEYFSSQEELPLFDGMSWKDWRDTKELENIVVQYVDTFPRQTRKNLWHPIIRDNFMRYTESEYKKTVTSLVKSGRIDCATPIRSKERPTSRLNDNCVLVPRS